MPPARDARSGDAPTVLHHGLYEAHLPVTDLARSVDFYGRLGFGLAHGGPSEPGALLFCTTGTLRWMLGLFRVETIVHRHPAEYHLAFRVCEADLDDIVERLVERGIQPVHPPGAPVQGPMSEPIVHGWMPAAAVFFRDPDGHLLELLAELDGPPHPELSYRPLREWRAIRRRAGAVRTDSGDAGPCGD